MSKTLIALLLGVGAGYVVFLLLHSEKGGEWKEKIIAMIGDVGEEIKNRILAELENYEATTTNRVS